MTLSKWNSPKKQKNAAVIPIVRNISATGSQKELIISTDIGIVLVSL
jgi:hypothetical protein